MSEMEFDRCDRECEQIFIERDLNASIAARAEAMACDAAMEICRAKAAAVQHARRRKSWGDACWLAAVMVGIFTAMCGMYIVGRNVPMAIMTGILDAAFFTAYEFIAPKAAAYKGKRVRV